MSPLPASATSALLSIRLDQGELVQVLDGLVAVAKDAVDGADDVSITLVRRDRPWTASYTGQLALAADELQYERGYGPCIDAGLSGTTLRVDDMRDEPRWPDYAAAVAASGVLASLSVPLPLQTDIIGALNCYSRTPSAFADDDQAAIAEELTGHIAVAVANAVAYADASQFGVQMQEAMVTRSVIEQAKGVIMAQNRCTPDQAFEILRRASMNRNMKINALADVLVRGLSEPSSVS